MELTVAIGISAVSILLIAQFLSSVQSQFATLQDKIRAEVGVSELMFYVHHYLGMAVDLTRAPGNLNLAAFPTTFGSIREYSLADWAPGNGDGQTDTIAFFLRDTLSSRDETRPAANVRFQRTGIFFQRPTVDRYGVLYLTVNVEPADNAIRPQLNDLYFENLVDFNVRGMGFTPDDAGREMVYSVLIDVTQRSYLPGVAPDAKAWCPPNFINTPACVHGNQAYRDVTKTFAVKIRNNVLGSSVLQKVRGVDIGLAPQYVPRPRRTYENIYFLRPFYPKEALSR